MDDVQFVWVGDGSLIDECRAAVSTELRGRIQFVGFMEDVAPYFAAATVYLQLSTVENLSLSVLDALRYGLPTILTRVGGMPEQTIDGVSGILVAPGDMQGAADATVWMLSSDDRVANMSEGARILYLTRFGPQVWEKHMDLLHAEALAS
jgi:glycosyltransferase involved in cell wall biosynthesis